MYGQLGHGSTDKQSSPKVVEALSDKTVYLLACGNFHTVSTYLALLMKCRILRGGVVKHN